MRCGIDNRVLPSLGLLFFHLLITAARADAASEEPPHFRLKEDLLTPLTRTMSQCGPSYLTAVHATGALGYLAKSELPAIRTLASAPASLSPCNLATINDLANYLEQSNVPDTPPKSHDDPAGRGSLPKCPPDLKLHIRPHRQEYAIGEDIPLNFDLELTSGDMAFTGPLTHPGDAFPGALAFTQIMPRKRSRMLYRVPKAYRLCWRQGGALGGLSAVPGEIDLEHPSEFSGLLNDEFIMDRPGYYRFAFEYHAYPYRKDPLLKNRFGTPTCKIHGAFGFRLSPRRDDASLRAIHDAEALLKSSEDHDRNQALRQLRRSQDLRAVRVLMHALNPPPTPSAPAIAPPRRRIQIRGCSQEPEFDGKVIAALQSFCDRPKLITAMLAAIHEQRGRLGLDARIKFSAIFKLIARTSCEDEVIFPFEPEIVYRSEPRADYFYTWDELMTFISADTTTKSGHSPNDHAN